MEIILTIPTEKIDEFRAGFLKRQPVPLDDEGTPEMTELQWFKFWIRRRIMKEYMAGKRALAAGNAIIDEEVIS